MEITVIKNGMREITEILRAESHGGRILLLTEEDAAGEDLVAALAVAGISVTRRKVKSALLMDYFTLTASPIPEGTMAVVGAGGYASVECVKGLPLSREIPRLLIPTDLSALSALDARAFFCTKGEVLKRVCDAARVLFSTEILSRSDRVREGLGALLARLIEGLDGCYENLILKGSCPADPLVAMQEAASLLGEIKESDAAACVTQVALSWAQKGVFTLSASDSAHLFALLSARQTGEEVSCLLFPAAYALFCLYERYLSDLPLDRAAPPDRARNVELLMERCGLDPLPLFDHAALFADGYRDKVQVTGEYREDLADFLTKSRRALTHIARVYRRTPRSPQEGSLPSVQTLLSLLSLTGEAVSGYPLLRHIKLTGLLEPLLSAG